MDALDCRLHDRHAGVPGQRPHRVQGPPLRRRRAALGERHAQPSADADDRRQPGARAAGAAGDDARPGRVAAARRPGRPSRGRRLEPRRSASASTRSSKTASRSRSPMRRQRRPAAPRRRGQGPAAGLRRLRPGDRPAARTSASRASGESASLPPVDGLSRDRLGQLLGGDQRARWRTSCAAGGAARQVDALALDGAGRRAGREHRRLGARAVGGGARARRCSSTAPRRRRRSRRRRRRAAAHDVGARLERILAAVARRARRARRAPPGRRRRRDLGRVRAGARRRAAAHRRARSIPACPGAMPRRRSRAEGMHLALKSGNFGGVDFFDRAFDRGAT